MLTLDDINKSFANNRVLSNVSVAIHEGITGIAGANGCGKTSVLKILAGLMDRDSGAIEYDSRSVDVRSAAWRSDIGYVPQTIGLYNRMTVYELLDYLLVLSKVANRKTRKDRIEFYGEHLNITTYFGERCGNLSGGVKQRVGIVQALIHEPKIILLDEPTNNLDVEERERFHAFLQSIKAGRIILYIGHILDELMSVCGHVIILRGGKTVFNDTPAALLREAARALRRIHVENTSLPNWLKQEDILEIVEENGKRKITYRAAAGDPHGSSFTPGIRDAYKLFALE